MRTWFTSDLHLGHPNVSMHRGFSNTADHDMAIISGWSEVRPDDIVWVLGDIAVHKPMEALNKLSFLPGRKRLISGNHDSVHPMHHGARKHFQAFAEVFEYVAPSAVTRIAGQEVLLSHFPYRRDRVEARFIQWRLPDLGTPLLHGHLHDKSRLFGRELHVGVDAWNLGLVPERTVGELLAFAQPGKGLLP